ncbi:MAG: hypothetical protein EXR01_08340 [Acetobacteraceae bacterium]|nr:hypothetical protein [Acetobacteraceae bacterium]
MSRRGPLVCGSSWRVWLGEPTTLRIIAGLDLPKYSKGAIKNRLDEAVHILDIMPLLDRKPKALSGG